MKILLMTIFNILNCCLVKTRLIIPILLYIPFLLLLLMKINVNSVK